MSELTNEAKRAKRAFFNVSFGDKKKGKAKGKKPEEAMPEAEPQPTAQELRAQAKAAKPVSKGFLRLTPRMPKLR